MSSKVGLLNSVAIAAIVFFLFELREYMLESGYSNLQTIGTIAVISVAIVSAVAIIDRVLKKKST